MNSLSSIAHQPDIQLLRADFPALSLMVHGKPLVYLDSAASSQMPESVIDAVARYQRESHANVHRGVHWLSQEATAAYEGARDNIQDYLGARSRSEIVFTRGTTEAINLVAAGFASSMVPGDEILLTGLEHHSNIVPWQLAAERSGAVIKVAPLLEDGSVDLDAFRSLLGERTKIAAFAHVSNALGTVNPVTDMTDWAKSAGAQVLIDGAQAVPHQRVDVSQINCDFYAFSGHKMFGPTGIGVLYGREAALEALPPYQGGGDMILTVRFDKSTYNKLPYRFEAGTPNISGAIGLGAAVDYLKPIDFSVLHDHEADLVRYAEERILALGQTRIIGTAHNKVSVVSFVMDDIHAHDLGTIVDQEGVAIRAGHHCAMPVMERFGLAATARASFALYNNRADVDGLIAGLERARALFTG